ncbi:BTB/POZ domain-containing protein 6-A-like [Sitodiplosis mosellana]|uniref:BTB/POZ domain-containing protein 6-A-like n=1 Tax=Sitodiplosis mosellana TaxID=263140 RepID=UPI0024448EB8|nr:BTB/POZ domain-containing protein 6-A-like [Sitodiplosis mosellana]
MSNVQAPEIAYENQALLTDLGKLYMDATASDVNFIFKPPYEQEENIPAHKTLLATRSDVFHAMFYGEVKEKADVNIVDATPAAFKEFLKFFYLSKVHVTMENVSGVMNPGEKYNVAACMDACGELLTKNLTVEKACFIYGLAILYEQEELKRLCEEKIVENTEAIFASRSFLDSPKSVLRHALNLDKLSCSEADVFKACMAWVKSASGGEMVTKREIRLHLGDLFYEIRFRSMTIKEFADLIPSFGHVFYSREHKECVQLIGSKDFRPKNFTTKTRQPHGNNYKIIGCNRVLEYTTKYCSLNHVSVTYTTFSTNTPIMLVEVVFASLRIRREDKWRDDLMDYLPTEITIAKIPDDKGDTKVLVEQTAYLRVNGTVVTLWKPVLTRPGNKYQIQLKHSLNEHCYKIPVLKTEVELEPNIVIQFHNDPKTKGGITIPTSPIISLRFAQNVE